MPRTLQIKPPRRRLEAQFTLAARLLEDIDTMLDDLLEQRRDLEVKHALALYRAGRNHVSDPGEIIAQMRRRTVFWHQPTVRASSKK